MTSGYRSEAYVKSCSKEECIPSPRSRFGRVRCEGQRADRVGVSGAGRKAKRATDASCYIVFGLLPFRCPLSASATDNYGPLMLDMFANHPSPAYLRRIVRSLVRRRHEPRRLRSSSSSSRQGIACSLRRQRRSIGRGQAMDEGSSPHGRRGFRSSRGAGGECLRQTWQDHRKG